MFDGVLVVGIKSGWIQRLHELGQMQARLVERVKSGMMNFEEAVVIAEANGVYDFPRVGREMRTEQVQMVNSDRTAEVSCSSMGLLRETLTSIRSGDLDIERASAVYDSRGGDPFTIVIPEFTSDKRVTGMDFRFFIDQAAVNRSVAHMRRLLSTGAIMPHEARRILSDKGVLEYAEHGDFDVIWNRWKEGHDAHRKAVQEARKSLIGRTVARFRRWQARRSV